MDILHEGQHLVGSVTARVVAPVDAVFDVLEGSSTTLLRQAEALEAAARALEETAVLMKTQAQMYERAIHTLRQPTELVKAVTDADRDARSRPRE